MRRACAHTPPPVASSSFSSGGARGRTFLVRLSTPSLRLSMRNWDWPSLFSKRSLMFCLSLWAFSSTPSACATCGSMCQCMSARGCLFIWLCETTETHTHYTQVAAAATVHPPLLLSSLTPPRPLTFCATSSALPCTPSSRIACCFRSILAEMSFCLAVSSAMRSSFCANCFDTSNNDDSDNSNNS